MITPTPLVVAPVLVVVLGMAAAVVVAAVVDIDAAEVEDGDFC